ncbi:hypothetical protein MRX96_012194 [Rhipicephalus microplus]
MTEAGGGGGRFGAVRRRRPLGAGEFLYWAVPLIVLLGAPAFVQLRNGSEPWEQPSRSNGQASCTLFGARKWVQQPRKASATVDPCAAAGTARRPLSTAAAAIPAGEWGRPSSSAVFAGCKGGSRRRHRVRDAGGGSLSLRARSHDLDFFSGWRRVLFQGRLDAGPSVLASLLVVFRSTISSS